MRKTWVIAVYVAMCVPVLAESPETTRISSLIEQLDGRNWVAAVEELSALGDLASPALVDSIAHADGRRAGRACEALARIGGPDAERAVFAACSHDDPRVRRSAAWALRHFPGPAALRLLIELRDGDSDGRTRRNSVRALGHIGGEEAIAALRTALSNDAAEYVRIQAIRELAAYPGAETARALAGAMADPSNGVAREAAQALADSDDHAGRVLTRHLSSDDAVLRRLAVWVAGQLEPDLGRDLVRQAMSDGNWMVQNEAKAAIERWRQWRGPLWPDILAARPPISSPTTLEDGRDTVTALTLGGTWAVVPASPEDAESYRTQTLVDRHDFPALASTGLHDPQQLADLSMITGRSLAEITELGRPGGLSGDGFMAVDEDILSVLLGDNRIVAALGLTHPQLARPLMQVWNMINFDAGALRWDMAAHRWAQFDHFVYNQRVIRIVAGDTKGGQLSIFDDGLEGAFWIEIEGVLTEDEQTWLEAHYAHLETEDFATLVERLTTMLIGELEPHYIQRYGFYEGHTGWRADPIAIAFIFGLKSLEELEESFPGRLDKVLTTHHLR